MDNLKGEKIRVARFKSKVRYRKVRGFRPQLTKLKVGSI
jgi:large subunit ribosomal protein L21